MLVAVIDHVAWPQGRACERCRIRALWVNNGTRKVGGHFSTRRDNLHQEGPAIVVPLPGLSPGVTYRVTLQEEIVNQMGPVPPDDTPRNLLHRTVAGVRDDPHRAVRVHDPELAPRRAAGRPHRSEREPGVGGLRPPSNRREPAATGTWQESRRGIARTRQVSQGWTSLAGAAPDAKRSRPLAASLDRERSPTPEIWSGADRRRRPTATHSRKRGSIN